MRVTPVRFPSLVRTWMLRALWLLPASVGAQNPGGPLPVQLSPPALSTFGEGEAKLTPDRVAVMVNVQTRAATASAAASANAARTRAVLDALTRLGLTREQLSTEGYNVAPEMNYDRNGGTPRVTGYVVTNTVRAESRNPDQAGAMIDAALGAGANVINGLSFYASSTEEARRQALASAVERARADAESMARAAGGAVGELLELSSTGANVPPRPVFDMAMRVSAEQASTPVNPGLLTVHASVVARWRFIPR